MSADWTGVLMSFDDGMLFRDWDYLGLRGAAMGAEPGRASNMVLLYRMRSLTLPLRFAAYSSPKDSCVTHGPRTRCRGSTGGRRLRERGGA